MRNGISHLNRAPPNNAPTSVRVSSLSAAGWWLCRVFDRFASVTDAGVRHLTNMSNLESLTLWFSRIDGKGFSDGKNLKSLRSLVLYGSQLNDEGLAHAAKLPALEGISLERTRVTPQGMKALLQAKKTLKRVTPTEPVYTGGAELDNPYFRVAEEIKKLAPEIKFYFSVDAPP